MLTFSHQGKMLSLSPGTAWTPSGSDRTYRDAPTDEVRDIIRAIRSGKPWRQVVSDRYAASNPWLHQIVTSPQRDLFFRQQTPRPGNRILDIGSGWGQIALPLARSQAKVVALEPTPERLGFIQAAAEQEKLAAEMYFVQADFLEVNFQPEFDLVTCVGVLEWTPKFREGNPRDIQIDFLRRARLCLAQGGKLVIGIENRIGLKYLLGAPDDHIGVPGIAVFDATLASKKWKKQSGEELRSFTFTRTELAGLLREAGFTNIQFHAALPDYKLPEKILPLGEETNAFFSAGNFVPEHDGCTGNLLPSQDELRSHYRSLAEAGVVSEFVPSFFVQASA